MDSGNNNLKSFVENLQNIQACEDIFIECEKDILF